jgi:adenylate kinase
MLNLIIFGPPGAGKGTQAKLIATQHKLVHLSSGEILRQKINNDDLGRKIKKYQDAGELIPNNLIIEIFQQEIIETLNPTGFVFDGYPRNIKQAKSLDLFLETNNLSVDLVLNLQLKEKTALDRIMSRAKTSQRSDDNIKTIEKRFEVYQAQTKPLLEYYKTQNKLIDINNELGIADVFQQIEKIIKNKI